MGNTFTYPLTLRIPRKYTVVEFPPANGEKLRRYTFLMPADAIETYLTNTMPEKPKCNPRAPYRRNIIAAQLYKSITSPNKSTRENLPYAHPGIFISTDTLLTGDDDEDYQFLQSDENVHGPYNGNTTRISIPSIRERCQFDDLKAEESGLEPVAMKSFYQAFFTVNILTGIPGGETGRHIIAELAEHSNGSKNITQVSKNFIGGRLNPLMPNLGPYNDKIEFREKEHHDTSDSCDVLPLGIILKLLRYCNPLWSYTDPYQPGQISDAWSRAFLPGEGLRQDALGMADGVVEVMTLAEHIFLKLQREKFMLNNLYRPKTTNKAGKYFEKIKSAQRAAKTHMQTCTLVFTEEESAVSQVDLLHVSPILRGFSKAVDQVRLAEGFFEWKYDPYEILDDKKTWSLMTEEYERSLKKTAWDPRNALKREDLVRTCEHAVEAYTRFVDVKR